MSTAQFDSIGLWSLKLSPTTSVAVQLGGPLRLTSITLDYTAAIQSGRTTLVLKYTPPGGSSYISSQIASVISPFNQNAALHVVLRPGTTYIFETVGHETIHLAGYFLDQEVGHHDQGSGDRLDILDYGLASRHAQQTLAYSVDGLSTASTNSPEATQKRKQNDYEPSTSEYGAENRTVKRLKAGRL